MIAPIVFRRKRVIEPCHTDRLGHVNNRVWVDFVLDLASAHSEALGIDFEACIQHGGLWIVHRQEIDYLRPAFPGDRIIEETWIELMRGARSVRHSRFSRQGDSSDLVCAVTQWVWVDPTTHRPRRIPRALLEAFQTSAHAGPLQA